MNNSAANHYAPAVPISVYRELAAELSSTRTQMETYKFQNQQLVEQNQKLRLEIERVVQSTLHLRQIADAQGGDRFSVDRAGMDYAMPPLSPPLPTPPTAKQRPTTLKRVAMEPPKRPVTGDRLVTEQQEPQPRRSTSQIKPGISGGWLMIIIGAIVITAFGTGFLIVRPLLPTR